MHCQQPERRRKQEDPNCIFTWRRYWVCDHVNLILTISPDRNWTINHNDCYAIHSAQRRLSAHGLLFYLWLWGATARTLAGADMQDRLPIWFHDQGNLNIFIVHYDHFIESRSSAAFTTKCVNLWCCMVLSVPNIHIEMFWLFLT